MVVAGGTLDLRDERGEQRLAVRDAGQAVVRRTHLGLDEGATGPVEGPRQALLRGDATLMQRDRLIGFERLLQAARQAIQAPRAVGPGHAQGRRDAGRYGEQRWKDDRPALGGWHGGDECEDDDDAHADGDGRQKAQGTNDFQHAISRAWGG